MIVVRLENVAFADTSFTGMQAYYFGHSLITMGIPVLKKKCAVKIMSV